METVSFCEKTLIGKFTTTVAGEPPVGFISVEPDNSIAALYVAPTGQGTGSALLTQMQENHSNLNLWVFQANSDAIRFYKKHGFEQTRSTDGDNTERLPDIQMEWHA